MYKRVSFYAVFVFLVAALFMTAGCAKQDIVKNDEGIASPPVAKPVDSPKSNDAKPSATPAKQAVTTPVAQVTPSPVSSQQVQKSSSVTQLQSSLDKIYFDFDSANLSEAARNSLSKNAASLVKEPAVKIRIEGNCDDRGAAEYNLALGERRAKVAQKYLITLGVKSDRLSVISYGKEKAAAQGNDEAAWAKNRRDEFVVAQ